MRFPSAALGVVLAAALATPAAAQIDLTGTWNLEMTTTLPGEETPCLYQGTVQATQATDDSWNGPVELSLVSGPQACPAEMLGDGTGFVEQGEDEAFITGTIDGGEEFGLATFDGTILPNPGGGGDFSVDEGEFADEEGTWSMELLQSVLEIPAATPVGLAVLTFLLLGAGGWVLSRQGTG
ncbi:MAG: hypothetical protein ACLF0P_13855 [Thermoanaerobaculia bacterium]